MFWCPLNLSGLDYSNYFQASWLWSVTSSKSKSSAISTIKVDDISWISVAWCFIPAAGNTFRSDRCYELTSALNISDDVATASNKTSSQRNPQVQSHHHFDKRGQWQFRFRANNRSLSSKIKIVAVNFSHFQLHIFSVQSPEMLANQKNLY